MSAEITTDESQYEPQEGFWDRNAGPIMGTGVFVLGAGLMISLAFANNASNQEDIRTVAAVQGALPGTGFRGTVREVDQLGVDESFVDLDVSSDCTLPGVIVTYTLNQAGAEDSAHITGFEIQEYYLNGSGAATYDFTSPTSLDAALHQAGQTCQQAASILNSQNIEMGVQ